MSNIFSRLLFLLMCILQLIYTTSNVLAMDVKYGILEEGNDKVVISETTNIPLQKGIAYLEGGLKAYRAWQNK